MQGRLFIPNYSSRWLDARGEYDSFFPRNFGFIRIQIPYHSINSHFLIRFSHSALGSRLGGLAFSSMFLSARAAPE